MNTPSNAVEVEIRVDAPPELVFSCFTDAAKYQRWKGVDAELDPRPGGIYRVQMTGRSWVRGEFVEVEPPRRLVFTWGWEGEIDLPEGLREVRPGSTRVEVTFQPDGTGTIVRLRHEDLPTDASRASHTAVWPLYLQRLSILTSGNDPGEDPIAAAAAAQEPPA